MELRSVLTIEVLVGLLVVQRLLELLYSRRNQRRLSADSRSADKRGAWVAMVVLHALWLSGCAVEVHLRGAPTRAPLFWGGIGLLAAGQALRWWAIATLGSAWNARAVVDPQTRVVTSGPYRFARHPNYTGLLLELAGLPLATGAWVTAALTLPLHLVVLFRRIRNEERLLRDLPGYAREMESKGLFFPRLRPSRTR
ncbi:MAG: hypothetical protein CMJ89_04160 [Planctomycetes bacterium]|nr:hypothetical protein [Planctomycetota bacterium]